MTRRPRSALIQLCVAIIVVTMVGAVPAEANHGDGRKLRAGLHPEPEFSYPNEDACYVRANIWIKEYGKHGVEQFKWRFRRYLGTINPNSPEAEWLRSVASDSGWFYSGSFPNDGRNYIVQHTAFGTRPMGGSSYTVRAKAVGIRPSWWQPDLRMSVHIGWCTPLPGGA